MDHGHVIGRHELTDQERELLAPLIPRAVTGRSHVADRQVVNGRVYKIRTGVSWRDLPAATSSSANPSGGLRRHLVHRRHGFVARSRSEVTQTAGHDGV
ncbi:transposase [Streptomyces sp. 900105755]